MHNLCECVSELDALQSRDTHHVLPASPSDPGESFGAQSGTNLEGDRIYEARSTQVPTLPQFPRLRAWKLALRDGGPDEGFRRVIEVDKDTYDGLQDSGPFLTLGSQIGAAPETGDLGCQTNLKKEQSALSGKCSKGRRIRPVVRALAGCLNLEMTGGCRQGPTSVHERVGDHFRQRIGDSQG